MHGPGSDTESAGLFCSVHPTLFVALTVAERGARIAHVALGMQIYPPFASIDKLQLIMLCCGYGHDNPGATTPGAS